MITVPSLLKPSGNGSMKRVFPPPDLVEITFEEIPTLSITTPPLLTNPPVCVILPVNVLTPVTNTDLLHHFLR